MSIATETTPEAAELSKCTARAPMFSRIRLYGYRGIFEVLATTSPPYDFHARPINPCNPAWPNTGWPALDSSIVEIDGRPVPMLSAPLTPPADDYPHRPQFDFHDGPPERAMEAIKAWHANATDATDAPMDMLDAQDEEVRPPRT